MPKTREWFYITMRRFRQRSTTTPVGSSFYPTVGRLVPITTVMMEISGVKMEQM
jgi:hypothetical protein